MAGDYKSAHHPETVSIVVPYFDVSHEPPIVDIVALARRHLVLRIG